MRTKLQQAGFILVGLIAGILVSLNFSANATKDAPPPLPVEELRAFADVFNAIKAGYVEPVDDKKLITQALSGMVSGLDPHSAYLDSDAFKDLQVGTQGEFGGLGIEVGMEDGFVKVVSPIEDTPAYRAGIKSGDLIVKLDDTAVKGMSLNDAVKRMRGKPNTKITLTIARKGEAKPIVVTIVREIIKVQSVKSKLLDSGYAVIRITQFQENTGEALVKHLGDLYKKGPLKGLVLDLRNDPGGLLNSAIGVSGAFLKPETLVVSTDGRMEDTKRKYLVVPEDYLRSAKDDYLKALPEGTRSVPMVVLVNAGSASASEIVAGALQDHKRAIVMGTPTFGKGSVQTVLPLANNTALKLTTARYYTPSGRSIQAKGITPDIAVTDTANGNTPVFLREADLEKHLSNDQDAQGAAPKAADKEGDKSSDSNATPAKPKKTGKAKDGAEEDEPRAPLELGSPKDYPLSQALNLLKGLSILQNK